MNIAICDNEPHICEEIKKTLQSIPSSVVYQIYEFHSSEDILASQINFDMIFLDIDLNSSLNGLQVAEIIQDKNPYLILIFISAYPKYVSSSFYFNTFQFLIKPIEPALLQKEFLRALDKYKMISGKYIIKYYNEEMSVNISDIVYIEAQKRKLFIKLKNNKSYETYGKISEQDQLVNTHNFLQPHRSFLVNPIYIESINNPYILLTTQEQIIISRKYQKSFQEAYSNYLIRWLI